MGQCNICEQPTQSGLCQECRLEEYYGVPDDHWDDEEEQPKDPELRSDGSGWGTMVDRDGNPLEPSDKFAGTHRSKSGGETDARPERNHPSSKYPDVRRALIDTDRRRVLSETVANDAETTIGTAEKWLRTLAQKGHIGRVRTPVDGETRLLYGVPEDASDVLPEVLRV